MDDLKFWLQRGLLLAALGGLISGCGVERLLPALPTAYVIPTVTDTPTISPSPTLTLTPTEIMPARAGTPFPPVRETISAENAGKLSAFAWYGKGIPISLTLSSDGLFLAAASTRGIYVFDAATLTETRYINTPTAQHVVAFSPDSLLLASAGLDGMISLWQLKDGRLLKQFKSNAYSSPSAMIFSPNGEWLISTDTNRVTHIWQVSDAQEMTTIYDNARVIQHLSFAGKDNLLFSWAPKEAIKIWDPATGRLKREIFVGQDELGDYALNGAFSTDGAFFAANSGLRVRIYRTSNGTTRQLIRLKKMANFVLLSPDGSRLVVVSADDVRVYEVGSQNDPLVLSLPGAGLPGPKRIVFSPDGNSLLIASASITRWKLESGSQPQTGLEDFASDYALDTVFTATDNRMVNVMLDGRVQVINALGVLERAVNLPLEDLNAASISPDGKWVVVSTQAGGVSLWTLDGQRKHALDIKRAISLSFSAEGLAAGAMPNGSVLVWQIEDGQVSTKIDTGEALQQVMISADGKRLAARSSSKVKLWDIEKNQLIGTFDGCAMQLSPDGVLLAVAQSTAAGQWIDIYQSSDAKKLIRINANGHWMAFSADHSLLAVGAQPLTLWRVNDGVLLTHLSTGGLIGRPAFIQQDKLLALIGWDETVHLWGVP